jgi:leader peptidase (prepilin peptidase) / N-methyltransferase
MTNVLGGVVMALGTMLGMVVLTRPILRRLPEPADGQGKPRYADLATPRLIASCALLAGAAVTVSWLTTSPATQPLWWVLSSFGVLLAAIDALTTWLPLRLTQAAWVAMTVALLLTLPLGADWSTVLRAVTGAALAGLLYLAVWLVSRGGFGFGDVRFAPLVGAATAAHSWSLLIWALLLGSGLGALYGIVRLARRRTGPFPYAPAMLVGAYLACGTAWTAA